MWRNGVGERAGSSTSTEEITGICISTDRDGRMGLRKNGEVEEAAICLLQTSRALSPRRRPRSSSQSLPLLPFWTVIPPTFHYCQQVTEFINIKEKNLQLRWGWAKFCVLRATVTL